MNNNESKKLESIIRAFPYYYRDAANSFDDDLNTQNNELTHIVNSGGQWFPIRDITTKELQLIFKNILNKTTSINFSEKHGLESSDSLNIINFRQGCKNPRLRHIHFRLIHDDFFTYSKMFKFKMSANPNCPRCGLVETTRHLLWECQESRNIWNLLNAILDKNGLRSNRILKYEDIYRTETNSIASILKMKIIQETIQIDRPKYWTVEKMKNKLLKVREMELITANSSQKKILTKVWHDFMIQDSMNNDLALES
jgi:hypothetical protein